MKETVNGEPAATKASTFRTPKRSRPSTIWSDSSGRRKVKLVYDLVGLAHMRDRFTPKAAAACLKGKVFARWRGPEFADRLTAFGQWVIEVAEELRT